MAQSLCTVSCMVMYHSAQHSSTMVPDLGPSWGNSGAREVKLMLCWVALAQVEPWGYLGYLGPRYFGAMLSHEARWGHVGDMLGVLEGEADHQVTGGKKTFSGLKCTVSDVKFVEQWWRDVKKRKEISRHVRRQAWQEKDLFRESGLLDSSVMGKLCQVQELTSRDVKRKAWQEKRCEDCEDAQKSATRESKDVKEGCKNERLPWHLPNRRVSPGLSRERIDLDVFGIKKKRIDW